MTSWLARLVRPRRSAPPPDHGFATVPWDRIPWEFDAAPERVVAVGDVQGDLEGLDAILRQTGLADEHGEWCGGRQHLVLLGDLVGGHADGRLVVEYVMRLEQQARRAGGLLHVLLGNHDVLPAMGNLVKWTRAERRLWQRHRPKDAPAARDAFRGDTALARWLRGRNAMVKIGETLFVHAGVGEWFARTRPGDVNATVRAWIDHWQGRGAEPPAATRWAAGVPGMARDSEFAQGPLWTRGFKPDGDRRPRGGPRREDLECWLDQASVRRLVLGHAPVDDGEVLLEHPYYGDRVVLVDTRISAGKEGRLCALELGAEGQRGLRFKHTSRDRDASRRERRALAAGEAAPSRWGWLRRLLAGAWRRLLAGAWRRLRRR